MTTDTNTAAPAETLYIYFFDWVAVPAANGREYETPVECNTYRDVLDLIAADDESMGYVPALRVTRIDRDFFDGVISRKTINRLANEFGPDVCAEGFAYARGRFLPEQTEIVWPTNGLRLEVPKRYRREVETRGWQNMPR